MSYRRLEPWKLWLFWSAVALVALLFLYLIRGILLPFMAGMAVAYFLDPLVDWLEERGLSRLAGTAMVSLIFFILAGTVIAIIGPMLVNQLIDLVASMPEYIERLQHSLFSLSLELSESTGVDLRARVQEAMASGAESAVGSLSEIMIGIVESGLAIVSVLSLLLITPIVGFFMLLEWDHIVARIDEHLPLGQRATLRDLFRRMDRVLAGFVRGQATVCLIMAVYYSLALTLAGLDYGLVIGVIAGILTFIPFIGSLTGLVLTVGIALAQYGNLTDMILPVALYLVGQGLEGNLLTPRLVGRQIRLHDLWVIFAVLAGGAVFGFWGALLAVPISGCLGVLVRFGLRRYRSSSFYLGRVQE